MRPIVPRKAPGPRSTGGVPMPLQRAQEVEDVLLLVLGEAVEVADHSVRLARGALRAAAALVLGDRIQQVRAAAVVQEEHALPQAPQRRGAELAPVRLA